MVMPSLFFADFYLQQNRDVADAVHQGFTTALDHFLNHGKAEGRVASPFFNPQEYLDMYPDVAAAVSQGITNAYDHFEYYGQYENRKPFFGFDPDFYAQANSDLTQVIANGLTTAVQHFMQFGLNELREFTKDFSFAGFRHDHSYDGISAADAIRALIEFIKEFDINGFGFDWSVPDTSAWDSNVPGNSNFDDDFWWDGNFDAWMAEWAAILEQMGAMYDYTGLQQAIINSGYIASDGTIINQQGVIEIVFTYIYGEEMGREMLDLVGQFTNTGSEADMFA